MVVSARVLALLRRLQGGIFASDVAALPPRQQQLIGRLEAGGWITHETYGREWLFLAKGVSGWVSAAAPRPDYREVAREHLDAVGLAQVSPFFIGQLPRRNGRPRIPAPRIYLKAMPEQSWNPATELDELALALLVRDPKACRALIAAHPQRRWERLRERIRAEALVTRARYFGVKHLIDLRAPRASPARPTKRGTRRDAYRRGDTEPVSGRRSRGQR